MIKLDGIQTVSDVCRSCNFGSTNCIVNVHFADGETRTYHIDDAPIYYFADRMKISVVSNVVVLDFY